ncbi:hypothetical protein [Streptomyces sp. NPDC001165]
MSLLRRETRKLMELAGVRRVPLYDARYAVLSWMANNVNSSAGPVSPTS